MSNPPSSPSNPPSDEDQLGQAIAEYLRAGESASPPERESFLAKYPELAGDLREFFNERDRLDELVRPVRELDIDPGPHPTTADRIRYFGDYELIEEIGHGGMGVIFKARQVSLNRIVALKTFLAGRVVSARERERFRAEAEAAAALNHPNIVPIYEVGDHEGRQYFSMKLIDGGSLNDRLSNMALDSQEAARLTATVARAVHFAHQRGILHRDLKPANILLESRSETGALSAPQPVTSQARLNSGRTTRYEPMIADFGLAKNLRSDSSLTHSEAVLGTPAFMSPEQAAGEAKLLTTATDVYGLGTVLYSALTSRPPFDGSAPIELLKQVTQQTPPAPSKLRAHVSRDLDTICLKCLEKDPARRYRSAEALADDLERYLAGQPIKARRTSLPERLFKWAKREPAMAALAIVSVMAVILGVLGLTVSNMRISREQHRTAAALDELQVEQRQTKQALWTSYLNQAKAHRTSGQPGQRFAAIRTLRDANNLRDGLDLTDEQTGAIRNEMIAALALPIDLQLEKAVPMPQIAPGLYSVALDSRFTRYAVIQTNQPIAIHSTEGQAEIKTLPKDASATGLSCSPEGRWLATHRTGTQGFSCWDLWTNELQPALRLDHIVCSEFSDDGELLATVNEEGLVAIYKLASRETTSSFTLPTPSKVRALSMDSHGSRLAVTGEDWVLLIDCETGREISRWPMPDNTSACIDMDWGPGDRQLAMACNNQCGYVFDVASGQRTVTLAGSHKRTVYKVGFHPLGRFVATYSGDGATRLWDAQTGDLLLRAEGVFCSFSLDGRQLALQRPGELQFYMISPSEVLWTSSVHESTHAEFSGRTRSEVTGATFHPRLPLLATCGHDAVRLWHSESHELLAQLPIEITRAIAFHPSGSDLITAGVTGLLKWPINELDPSLQLGPPEVLELPDGFVPDTLAVAADGSMLVVGNWGWGGEAMVIPWNHPDQHVELIGHRGIISVAVHPQGRWVATGNHRGQDAIVWDPRTGQVVKRFPFDTTTHVHFSADGTHLITVSRGKTSWWFTGSWQLDRETPGAVVRTIAGSEYAIAIANAYSVIGDLEIVDIASGRTLGKLETTPRTSVLMNLALNRDGSKLARVAPGQSFNVWDLMRLRRLLREDGLDWQPQYGFGEPGPPTSSKITIRVVLPDA